MNNFNKEKGDKEMKVVRYDNSERPLIVCIKDNKAIMVRTNKKIIDDSKVKMIRTFSDLRTTNNKVN